MNIRIQVDSSEFWVSLKEDILSSKDSIFLQTLSFEGDSVGMKLSNLLLTSGSSDKRILIDSTTKFKLSDKDLYSPRYLFDSELHREVQETRRMIGEMERENIQVRFVNPVGFIPLRFPLRNHKKLIVIDERICYIGGINFSEHNFQWHDMMLRIEDLPIAKFLQEDFLATWNGKNRCVSRSFEGIEFHVFDGVSNGSSFAKILDLVKKAKKEIFIESPYFTLPFFDVLREMNHRGVRVTLLAPEENNWRVMRDYTPWESMRSEIDLWLYRGRMTHLKAMLIDDHFLIVGSSNFDYLSYLFYQEILAVIRNPEVIQDFKRRVLEEDLKRSKRFEGEIYPLKARRSHLTIKSLKYFIFLRRVL